MTTRGVAVRVERHGGPEVLTVAQVDVPDPAADHVLVEVARAGVNYVDVYERAGIYPQPLPFTPGGEGVGRVVAVGEDVDELRPGDRVAWQGVLGSYASHVSVPVRQALRVPQQLCDDQAAALPVQGMTAHYLATDCYRIRPGDTVLIHAGAGGVGLLLTQIAKILQATVITTASSPAKQAASRAAGADHVLDYENVAQRVRDLTGGSGVHAVYDGVGSAMFEASLGALRRRGTLVLYGASSGQVKPLDPQRLAAAGSVFLTRPTLRDYVATRAELERRFNDLLTWHAQGRLKLTIHRSRPLSEVAAAHRELADRSTIGKLLLIP